MPDVDILRINGTDYKVHDSDGRALIAPEELTSTATKPHAIGEPFVHDGKLFRATDAISIGDTIVTTGTGANASQVPGGAMGEVADLKSAVDENLLNYCETVNPTNWFNPNGMKPGILKVDGTITEDDTKKYSDYFIPVTPGNTARLTRGDTFGSMYLYKVTAYDADKNVLPAKGLNSSSSTYTIPDGVAYIKFTMLASNAQYYPILTVSGDKPTSYVAYFDPYTIVIKDFVTPNTAEAIQKLKNGLSTADLKNGYAIALGKGLALRQTVGIPETWYHANTAFPFSDFVRITAGIEYTNQSDHATTFKNTKPVNATNGYVWRVYDMLFNTLAEETGTVGIGRPRKIIAENLSDCSALVIGDSTVDFDTMTQQMLDHFNAQGKTLTLLGTLGSGDNRNEGRAGWKASDYYTDKTYNGIVNPFYNPTTATFDFSYYMANQGYTGVDFVVIQLGINDLYNSDTTAIEPLWENISGMIDSIRSYNQAIKIILNLPTAPNSDPGVHSVFLPLYRYCVIKYNGYATEQALSKYGVSAVRCSYCHLILDPAADIRDNVHPTNEGFAKMALEVINQINCWQNGV